MLIKRNDVVAVFIDIQEKLFPFIYENEKLNTVLLKLIDGLKILHTPILITEQYPKGIGKTIPSLINLLNEDYKPIEKMTFSCCKSDEFMNALRVLNRKHVLITGIEAHVCVLQTTIELIENGYIPVIIEDAISSRTLANKLNALERMKQEGAIISNYESILFELCEISGTEEFKALSRIIK